MVFALATNAAVINIDATTANSLRTAINGAATGDVIVMAAGTYNESGDYLAFTGKELIVRAAEDADVIIKTVCPVRLKEGAKAEFVNVKFDCSTIGAYDYVIVAADDSDNKRVVLNGCEFYGWEKNKAMIEATSSRRLAEITINNCYFHDCMKSVVFIENTGSINLNITNSTFANIATNTESFWAGVIDSRAASGSVLVDHCTFYNVKAMNTDYAAIGKIATPGAVVSNSIFMLPVAEDGVRAIRDVSEAKNCLTYNYIKDGGGIHGDVTKTNCLLNQDPLFVDAANGNFKLGEGSPALTAGTDGKAIGDPRWNAEAPAEPKTKTIYCKMEHAWWTQDGAAVGIYTWDGNSTPKVAWPGERMTLVDGETNVWSFELDTAIYHMCIFIRVNASGDIADWGAKTKDLTIPADKNLFTIAATEVWGGSGCDGVWSVYGEAPEAPAKFYITGDAEVLGQWNPAAIKSTEDSYVLHLAAGAYKMKVTVDGTWETAKGIDNLTEKAAGLVDANGNIGFTLAEAGNVTVTYTSEVFKLEGAFVNTPIVKTYFATGEGWTGDDASSAVYDAGNAKIVVNLVQSKQAQWQAQVHYQSIVAQAGKNYDLSFKMKATQAINGVIVKYQENSEMLFKGDIALVANTEYSFEKLDMAGKAGNGILVFDFGFAPANTTVEIYSIVVTEKEAPVGPELADGFYLIGRIAGVDGWDINGLKAAHKFGPNLENPVEFMLSVTLAAGDEIQVVNVLNNEITAWFPGGEGNNFVITADYAGEKTVYFRPDKQGGEDWHHGCIYIQKNEASSLNNTNAAVKTVKVIENGQMYIIKNGVKYNALGTMMK